MASSMFAARREAAATGDKGKGSFAAPFRPIRPASVPAPVPAPVPNETPYLGPAPSFGALRGVSVFAPKATVQTKLLVGDIDDPLEREADRIADHVVHGTAPIGGGASPAPAASGMRLSRKCAECSKEEDEEAQVQRRADPAAARGSVSSALPDGRGAGGGVERGERSTVSYEDAVPRGGQPLSPSVRAYFEPRFGWSFADVRVHRDADAARRASALGARAYTVGRDIVFGSGAYAPDTKEGLHLLAHELTHTVQQANGAARVSRQPITPCDPAGCAAGPVQGSSSEFHDTPGTGVEDTHKRNEAAIQGPVTSPAPNLTAFVKQELVPRDSTLYNALLPKVNILVDLAHAAQTGAISAPGNPGTIKIPQALEDQAADYMSKGAGYQANSIGGSTVPDWKRETLMTFAHELEHHRDWPASPEIKAGRTNSAADTTAFNKELGDMDARLAEYSVHYDESVKAYGHTNGRSKTQSWVKSVLANGYGESLKGMITKLRCISPCDDVDKMVMRVFRWKLGDWSLEKQRFLLVVLKTDPYAPLSTLADKLLQQVDKKEPIP